MPVSLLDETESCALVDPELSFVIGSQTLGFPDQLRTDLVMHVGEKHGAYLGVTIRLPRSKNDVVSFFDSDFTVLADLSITIRWPLGSFNIWIDGLEDAKVKTHLPQQMQANDSGLLQVELRPNEKSFIDGIGFPFQGKDANVDSYVNSDGKIQGKWSLRDIFSQKRFFVLVKDTINSSLTVLFQLASKQKVVEAPYGNVYHWDVNRYKKQMAPENLKTAQDPVKSRFDDLNHVLTVIAQSIVQVVLQEFFIGRGCLQPITHSPKITNIDSDDTHLRWRCRTCLLAYKNGSDNASNWLHFAWLAFVGLRPMKPTYSL
ncbi:uncharacterized protein ColSpa_07297 [Colletotrichum spaethianum]|uniref:Uncharacterized protein n=1 Tax=Colletotrichum spaethianum TaxID=700344 RepID=A0AA37LF04_9PEZI|nr:uncharacterized protein ColSpa_07297 [Colletotrichum spaethianum]GKT47116.1 hypothetical protein ColSpa_07297 [Colletotrichum spaethianum]